MAPDWFKLVIDIGFGFLTVSMLLVISRLIRGPTLADRVVAIDLIGVLAVCFITLFTMAFNQPVYLDVAIAVALLSFVGTLAYARFVEWKGEENITRGVSKSSRENRL